MLVELGEILRSRFGLAEVRMQHKLGPARGVTAEQIAEMKRAGIDVAGAGIGD
jgi:hypothetical protein